MKTYLKILTILTLFFGIVICSCLTIITKTLKTLTQEELIIQEEVETYIPTFMSLSPREGLREALEYYDVLHPDIVEAQARLETGHFKSQACVNHNNLFGLYNSAEKRYFHFNNWWESVEKYKEWFQDDYTDTMQDYVTYLLEKKNYLGKDASKQHKNLYRKNIESIRKTLK